MPAISSRHSILFINYISRDLGNTENTFIQAFPSVSGCQTCRYKRGISNRKQFVALDEYFQSLQIKGESPTIHTWAIIIFNWQNYLTNCTSITPRLFTDDPRLVYGANTTDKLIESINLDLTKISKWMKANNESK